MTSAPSRLVLTDEKTIAFLSLVVWRSPTASMPWPSSFGAITATMRSTARAFKNDVMIPFPPSTSTDAIPRRPSSFSSRARSMPELSFDLGSLKTSAPRLSISRARAISADLPVTTRVPLAAPPASTRAVSGMRNLLSRMIRRGSRPSTSLTVSCGSSISTVPIPTNIASCSRRSLWARRRAPEPLIHFDSPVAVAMRPSSDWANFTVTKGARFVAVFLDRLCSRGMVVPVVTILQWVSSLSATDTLIVIRGQLATRRIEYRKAHQPHPLHSKLQRCHKHFQPVLQTSLKINC